jgi:hypothetical protein
MTQSTMFSPPPTSRALSQPGDLFPVQNTADTSLTMSSLGDVITPVPSPPPKLASPLKSEPSSHSSRVSSAISLTSQHDSVTSNQAQSYNTPIQVRPVNPVLNMSVTTPPQSKEVTSKLAKLAQARIHRQKPPSVSPHNDTVATGQKVPLAGVASKRSVTITTHITTTHQTLDSLTSPRHKSKLSMKALASQRAVASEPPPKPKFEAPGKEASMFSSSRTETDSLLGSAGPSSFAALLLDKRVPMSSTPRQPQKSLIGTQTRSSAFTFNSPSPDDIVADARRGTALHNSQVRG